MNRNHIHLSATVETAKQVGSRHGKPRILMVRSGELFRAGQVFYQSDNGVWLTTQEINPDYIELVE